MPSRFYVTTPIYYINDVPHLGTAYTTVAADVLARYHRLRGHETRFLTGTDEHGLKVQRSASERGQEPIRFADELSGKFRAAWPALGCAPDDFIRTTEERHTKGVQELWRRIVERDPKNIYLGHYEGLYCVACEAYYTEKDLVQPGNVCPIHRRAVELVKEESYFFKLKAFRERLVEFYTKHPEALRPEARRNEVMSFLASGLEDLSVSRTTFDWGIPVPGDPRHVMYVWFDALANYWTALREPEDNTRFWPPLHLVGKDIIRFHCIYWHAFLMAAGFPDAELPSVFAHGFLSYGGQKMSKTLRNTVSPVELARAVSETVGVDTVRYCLMRSISFGQDGDFSIDDVLSRYATDLGNSLGNLLNRILPFPGWTRAGGASRGDAESKLIEHAVAAAADSARAYDDTNPTRALEAIWTLIAHANRYVDSEQPWVSNKNENWSRLNAIIGTLTEVLDGISIMISPVMPEVARLIREQLGVEPLDWTTMNEELEDRWPTTLTHRVPGTPLQIGAPIFPRLDKEREAELKKRFTFTEAAPAAATAAAPEAASGEAKPTIGFSDFTKLDLRVGIVVSAERVKKKDKLLELRVDTGDAAPRRIIAGLAASYAPEELVGKRVVVLCNLAPRDFGKGLVSEGMLLAADSGERLRALSVEGELGPGAPVR